MSRGRSEHAIAQRFSPPRRQRADPVTLASVEDAIADIRAGKFVIIVDDEDRENEGDLAIAADRITPEAVNFMATNGRGLICVPCEGWRLDELGVGAMVDENTSRFGTAFTVTIEAIGHGVTTGISVFERAGQTEAIVDLCKLAGRFPARVICEVMRADGRMARRPDLDTFAAEHSIKIVTVDDIIAYRRRNERLVVRGATTTLPTEYGTVTAVAYEDVITHVTHVALVWGDVRGEEPILVRVHSECLTGDVFGSQRCDCQAQLHKAMAMIADAGRGVLVYLRQEGRGIGLMDKLRAYALQDRGLDTVEANVSLGLPVDKRDYGIGTQILSDVGVKRMVVLTNNPRKYYGLSGYGLEVTDQIPLVIPANAHNERYLRVKQQKLGHSLDLDDAVDSL